MEDDVGGQVVSRRPLQPPALERVVERVVGLRRPHGSHGRRVDLELPQKAARLAAPGQREVALGTRQADIEEAALLRDLPRPPGLPDRQLLLLDPRNEDDLELETFRPVQREQVHAAPVGTRRSEPSLEIGYEVGGRPVPVVEVLRQADEP